MVHRYLSQSVFSFVLVLIVLVSLSAQAFAADSHASDHIVSDAVYPAEPYSYDEYPSPNGEYTLRMRRNPVDWVTYYDALVLMKTVDGSVVREFDLHKIRGFRYGYRDCRVHWSPDSKLILIEHDDPGHGLAVLVIDVGRAEFRMPQSTMDIYNSMRYADSSFPYPPKKSEILYDVWRFEAWDDDGGATLLTQYGTPVGYFWVRVRMTAGPSHSFEVVGWGDAADLDDPENPIWKRTVNVGAPAYNAGSFTVVSPDGTCSVTVNAAEGVRDAETWNPLYRSVTIRRTDGVRYGLMLLGKDNGHMLWRDITVRWSADSRFAVLESRDTDAVCFIVEMREGGIRYLERFSYENFPGTVSGEATAIGVEGFSAFGQVMYVVESEGPDGAPRWLRVMDTADTLKLRCLYAHSSADGAAEPDYARLTPVPTFRDGVNEMTAAVISALYRFLPVQ